MIPKNIFQSWHTTNLHPVIQKRIDRMKQLNPDYNHKIYTDKEIDDFVNEHFPGQIAECYNRLNIIVAKVDFWRYLVLYKYGGVYLDMDSGLEAPLDKLIKKDDEAIISAENNPNTYLQWCLMFTPRHPILELTIAIVVDNIKSNRYPNDIFKMTGPYSFSNAIFILNKKHCNKEPINKITKRTDITLRLGNASYRIYSIDYGNFCLWKCDDEHILYKGIKYWRTEQREKPLLK